MDKGPERDRDVVPFFFWGIFLRQDLFRRRLEDFVGTVVFLRIGVLGQVQRDVGLSKKKGKVVWPGGKKVKVGKAGGQCPLPIR